MPLAITAQSQFPNTRAYVPSSVALGVTEAPGVGVQPESRESVGGEFSVDTAIEEVGDRFVAERHGHRAGVLREGDELLNIEGAAGSGDSEAANFRVTLVTEVLKFQPGQR